MEVEEASLFPNEWMEEQEKKITNKNLSGYGSMGFWIMTGDAY